MGSENKRLVLQIEDAIRELNRTIINPVIPELKIEALSPVIAMVARARAEYLRILFEQSKATPDGLPSQEEIAKLQQARVCFEELMQAAQALQTAIERDYLDVGAREKPPAT